MAVEARHLNLFPPQILTNRESVTNGVEVNGNAFAAPFGYGAVAPSTAAAAEYVLPMYGGAGKIGAAMKCDSGLTYAPVSRKRSREAINSLLSSFPAAANYNSNSNRAGGFTFLGEDVSFQIQQQQLEIDRFLAQHTEKVRMEIEERRRRNSRRIAAAVEETVVRKLKAREEEIHKMGKLNAALEERVKSLCAENQIWRDLAQSNEATANALRSNLEQVRDEQQRRRRADEASSSCCGGGASIGEVEGCIAARACRSCGREESCVLVLPCRHLCLCTVCGSTRHTCPVCNATKTASVHVNLSG